MLVFILRRLLWMIPVLVLVSFAVFSLLLLLPGDPAVAMLGDNATPESLARAREELFAAHLLATRDVERIPVVEEGLLRGVLTRADVARRLLASR